MSDIVMFPFRLEPETEFYRHREHDVLEVILTNCLGYCGLSIIVGFPMQRSALA